MLGVPLYDMTNNSLQEISPTSFQAEGVLERQHLQAALVQDVGLLGDDLLVVAEEYGNFEGAQRRIDLLCLDRTGRLVVVELKRTSDGGHMDLQSLRYAAMVSTMTRSDLEQAFRAHLTLVGDDPEEADERLSDWLTDVDETDVAVPSREVRIILVSGGFDREITSTVLWLNDIYGLDIRCVRLTPYRVGSQLLLDVQPLIPLPEATEFTVQVRRREQAAKASTASGRDLTKYRITTPSGTTEPLAKRHAVMQLVLGLHACGVPAEKLATAIQNAKFLDVEGVLSGQTLIDTFHTKYPKSVSARKRWFFESPIHEEDRTWVLSNQWGLKTEPTMNALLKLSPNCGCSYEAV